MIHIPWTRRFNEHQLECHLRTPLCNERMRLRFLCRLSDRQTLRSSSWCLLGPEPLMPIPAAVHSDAEIETAAPPCRPYSPWRNAGQGRRKTDRVVPALLQSNKRLSTTLRKRFPIRKMWGLVIGCYARLLTPTCSVDQYSFRSKTDKPPSSPANAAHQRGSLNVRRCLPCHGRPAAGGQVSFG